VTSVEIHKPEGGVDGSVDLPAEVFDVAENKPLMHQVVVAQLAAARQGTHKAKNRGEVRGGGKKPYRQKGTGRARQGSTRAPQFAGGGTVHGPVPRDYAQKTPKKMKQAALRGALSDRARNGRVHVLTGIVSGSKPSTKTARTAIAALSNLPAVHVIAPDQLNTYDVLVNDDVVFTAEALDTFLAGPARGRSARAIARSSEAEDVTEESK
jgi:large subunit ribosomal protein L4